MRAIDTNIVLRVIVNDDPVQTELARKTIDEPCLVGLGVLMESAWVLGSTYGLPRRAIADALETIVNIDTVRVPHESGVRWAIDRYRNHGADLAGMLHIVAAQGSSRFTSFGKHLAKQAGPDTPLPIEQLR